MSRRCVERRRSAVPARGAGSNRARDRSARPRAIRGRRRGAASLGPRMAFYVTTPIYYVNAAPHLGHAYTTIGADILARHHRQRGEEVFFLTGTDEHGEPVAQAAEARGSRRRSWPTATRSASRTLMPLLNASNDFFIRTTDPRHKAAVQEVMQRVHDNGHVVQGPVRGLVLPACADFKTEAEIAEDNTCPIHRIPLDARAARRTGSSGSRRFQEPLEQLYADQPDWVTPAHPVQRGAVVHQRRPATTSRSRARRRSSPGASRCRGTRSTCSTSGSTRS